jgi:hypothetical protein
MKRRAAELEQPAAPQFARMDRPDAGELSRGATTAAPALLAGMTTSRVSTNGVRNRDLYTAALEG